MIANYFKALLSRIPSRIYGIRIFGLLSLAPELGRIGWFLSWKHGSPVDSSGQPLPWLTYSAISFISTRIKISSNVFEYGSGNSTLWWAKRVSTITSCEHSLEWYRKCQKVLPNNALLHHMPLEYGGEYSRVSCLSGERYDVIVIDGRDRINCTKNAISALKEDGVIVFDNSDRQKYQEAYDTLSSAGFLRIDFWGLGPFAFKSWCSSIFYRRNNCFNI